MLKVSMLLVALFVGCLLCAEDNDAAVQAWNAGQSKWSAGNMIGARVHFEQASQLGYAKATLQLGFMYANAWGVDKDYIKARHYWKIGVENNDPVAIFQYGNTYIAGLGVEQDVDKALVLFRQAAALKNIQAMNILGSIYKGGIKGIEPDFFEGYRWYRSAFTVGDATAKDRADFCKIQALSSGDVKAQQRLSQIDVEVIEYCKRDQASSDESLEGKTPQERHYIKMAKAMTKGFMRDGQLDALEQQKLQAIKAEIMGTVQPLSEADVQALSERDLSDAMSVLITCGVQGGVLRDEQVAKMIAYNDRFAKMRQERCPVDKREDLDRLITLKQQELPKMLADKTIDQKEIMTLVRMLRQEQATLPSPKTKATTQVQIIRNDNKQTVEEKSIGSVTSFTRGQICVVNLDVGSEAGLKKGDYVVIKRDAQRLCKAKISKVGDARSIAEILAVDWEKDAVHLIKQGDPVFTDD